MSASPSIATAKADICPAKSHVRFTPESRHWRCANQCPRAGCVRAVLKAKRQLAFEKDRYCASSFQKLRLTFVGVSQKMDVIG
jgi:hypothetical protein